MISLYILATIGAVTLSVHAVNGARQFWKDMHSKGAPFLGGPRGGGALNGH